MKKLSIIVPVYNMEKDGLLEYCMDSLLHQTVGDYEIIAVNDASTDGSLKILRELEQRNPEKLKVFSTPQNLHQGGAKNLGIREASGEWLGFVDADDWVRPDMYEKLLKKAEETGADVVCCHYSLVYEKTMETGEVDRNNPENQMGLLTSEKYRSIILDSGSMVIKIYRRSMVLENALWFPEQVFYEDNCMSPLWLLHCRHMEQVPEPLYYYYQHQASTVHRISLDRCEDRLTVMDLFVKKMKEHNLYEEYLPEVEFKFTELYLVNTLFSILYGGVKKKYGFIRKMKQGMQDRFPHFQKNSYYQERIGTEERKLIGILMKSEPLFLMYFFLLRSYRKVRYGK